MRYPSNKSLLTHKLAIYSCTSWPGDHDWFSHGGSYPRLFSTKLYGSDVWWKDNVTTTLESSVPKFSFWLGEPDNLTEFVKLPILEAINPFNIGTIITRTSSIECGMEKVKHREQNQFAVFCLLQLLQVKNYQLQRQCIKLERSSRHSEFGLRRTNDALYIPVLVI